jgi:hypothetical protein
MRYATQDNGNHGDDDSLKAIENDQEGFGIPGQSSFGTVGGFKFADIGNEDENSTRLTALGDKPRATINLDGEPPAVRSETGAVTPGSLSTLVGPASKRNIMSMNARIAYVMENGEPRCNHCETNYFPSTRLACTNCGCGKPQDDHGLGKDNFSHVEGPNIRDIDDKQNIIMQESKTASASDEYMRIFASNGGDASKLYYQGNMDAMQGKPLDEDMALLSKDYYNGYQNRKFYNKTPQQSAGQSLFDIKPNSNAIPRSDGDSNDGSMTPGDYDRGPLELTDGLNHATASRRATSLPIDVIQKFFEV